METEPPNNGDGNDSAARPAARISGVLGSAPDPGRWRAHRLVKGEFFYTIPLELLDAVAAAVGQARFDRDLWQMERELSRSNGDHSSFVGFFRERQIHFGFMRESRPLDIPQEYLSSATASANPRDVQRQLEERVGLAHRNVRAYAGWLMISPRFLQEHAAVWAEIRPTVAQSSMPQGIAPIPCGAGTLPGLHLDPDEQQNEAIRSYAALCARWRLSRLAGPLLPEPIGQQTPAALPVLSGHLAAASGYGVIAIPDRMPLPSEWELRELAETSIRAPGADHLREWSELSSAANAAKKVLVRYARLFELQHWCRLLMSRHPDAFVRKLTHLCEALADSLGVSADTVRRDLRLIEQRLGKKWWERYPQPPLSPP